MVDGGRNGVVKFESVCLMFVSTGSLKNAHAQNGSWFWLLVKIPQRSLLGGSPMKYKVHMHAAVLKYVWWECDTVFHTRLSTVLHLHVDIEKKAKTLTLLERAPLPPPLLLRFPFFFPLFLFLLSLIISLLFYFFYRNKLLTQNRNSVLRRSLHPISYNK